MLRSELSVSASRPLLRRLSVIGLSTAVLLGSGALAWADPARDAVLKSYQADGGASFDAARGQAFYAAAQAGARQPDINSCKSCHGADPTQPGRNAKTGKVIDPMAVSVNQKRFTDPVDVEKWFNRNCPEIVGRACTAQEKGDFITFLSAR